MSGYFLLRLRQITILLLVAFGVWTLGPYVGAKMIENWALLQLVDGLQQNRANIDLAVRSEPILFDSLNNSPDLISVLNLLQAARNVPLAPESIEYTIGRLASAMGETEIAGEAFEKVATWAAEHSFAQLYSVFYASMVGDVQTVKALNTGMPRVSQLADESVVFTMLGEPSTSRTAERQVLESVLAREPGSLEALFRLYHMSGYDDVAMLRENLRRFTLDSAAPRHPLLFDRTVSILRQIAQQQIISEQTTLNLLKYFIWQRPDDEAVTTWLEEWDAVANPDDIAVRQLLAESYERQGNVPVAIAAYRSLLKDPLTAPHAAVRLTNLCAQHSACDAETIILALNMLKTVSASDWAADVLWATVCTNDWFTPGDLYDCDDRPISPAQSVIVLGSQSTLEVAADATSSDIAALLLNVPANSLIVGPNLLVNGDFEDGYENWRSVQTTGGNYSQGAFAVGLDDLSTAEGNHSLRIDGIWLDLERQKSIGRAGIVQTDAQGNTRLFDILPGYCVVVKGAYKTAGVDETVLMLLGSGQSMAALPPTNNSWRRTSLFYCNEQAQPEQATFSIRLRSTGQLWLDDLSLQIVERAR